MKILKLLYLLLPLTFWACQESESSKPNVLLILTDDQGYGDVSIHGNDSIYTPHLDQIAQEGIRMDNFYVSPVCAPTRASLLTGRYHYRTGTTWVTRNGEAMRSEEVTLAEVFKANGYATGCFGKWHNGSHYPNHPLGQGFDEFTGFCAGHWNNYFEPFLEAGGKEIQAKGYITDIITDSALSFIQRNKERPFFCYVPYNTPHTPFIVPQKYFDKYKALGLADRFAAAYGMVENIDDNVGRLLEKLEQERLDEHTLVIFITDNGPNFTRFNGFQKGRKGSVSDGGVRVPSFWRWKGKIAPGQISSALTAHIDVLPTLVEFLELSPVETLPLDGKSFAAILSDSNAEWPDRQFFTFANNLNKWRGAVRTKDYRLVVNGENKFQLTRLMDDRLEENGLNKELPKLASNLYQAYLDMFDDVTEDTGDFEPIPVGYKEAPRVALPAHEGFPSGDIHYLANPNGWANDWFINWTSSKDTITWKIAVANTGIYKVSLKYSCKPANVGAKIHLMNEDQLLTTQMNTAFVPNIRPSQELANRGYSAYDQDWGLIELGKIKLNSGLQQVQLFATEIRNGEVGECKGLILESVE